MCIKLNFVLCLIFCNNFFATAQIIIPIGGNSFVTKNSANGNVKISNKGIQSWKSKQAVISTYVYIVEKGEIKIAANHELIKNESSIKCTIGNSSKTSKLLANTTETEIGTWQIEKPGYIKIDLQGNQKYGTTYGEITNFKISTSSKTNFVKNNEGNYFYWGRRGPSVHLNYNIAAITDSIDWFYNEVEVPKNNDVIGSFFMANGFDVGYFGMQVNSENERRILFSVWSPFNTDDPTKIPEEKKIKMISKGANVYTGEFGNEGSGGQSYLKYNWNVGTTYKFLLHAQPSANNYTNYTAYFYATELSKWLLVASFSRPESKPYLSKLHSFLENFVPETGYIARKVFYKNQFVKTKNGNWQRLNTATFTADATAKIGYRLDYSGGVEAGKFYLKNCGFFNESTTIKTIFSTTNKMLLQEMDLENLNNLVK